MKKVLLTVATLLSFNLMAGEITNFTEEKFNTLQENNSPILIDVKASWCSTCKKQTAIIKEYFTENKESNITVLTVDYDEQQKWVKFFKAPRQSTLVTYIGNKKIDTTIAQSSKKVIFSQLMKIDQ
jgi:thiol-disulfide isomerase/thioredoxin